MPPKKMPPSKQESGNLQKVGQWAAGMTPQPIGQLVGALGRIVGSMNFPHIDFGEGPSAATHDDFGRPLPSRAAAKPKAAAAAAAQPPPVPTAPPGEKNLDEEDGLVQGDTFADYIPAKLTIGVRHPDHVVETTSLRSVQPPNIKYKLKLPEQLIQRGLLSALQLEAIIYACQQHETYLHNAVRAGFLIGDGAGVGKGRTIAGIIYENFLRGRKKAIWVSTSSDLKVDADRDFNDISADFIHVTRLEKQKYDRLDFNGVLFCTYSALIGKTNGGRRFKTRLDQIINWCGKDFDGVIVFDESHRAKNLYPKKGARNTESTKTGIAVRDLQERLPGARIVYASATGASEPCNMGYMSRLGLWGEGTEFENFATFNQSIDKRGIGAMELVAMEMKHRGMYIARQLSFQGVTFQIAEVPLTPEFVTLYDKCVDFWTFAEKSFDEAEVIAKLGKKSSYIMRLQFWGTHLRFFKYLCLSAKIDACVQYALQAVEDGKCAVIGLQSTGEAKTDQIRETMEDAGGELTDFISTTRAVFMSLLHFYPEDIDTDSVRGQNFVAGSDEDDEDSETEMDRHVEEMELLEAQGLDRNIARTNRDGIRQLLREKKQHLIDLFDEFADDLPTSTLDTLLDKLGGPRKVAEMTGRKGRMVADEDRNIRYEQRKLEGDADSMNIAEKNKFMKGEKLIAIISEAASSGISLQADRRVKNQRRRVHITLELAWSADRTVQQFGRTHRSNQTSAPEYIFLISEVAGEKRFASCVACRLERMGALTHGDRRATESRDLTMFNFETKFGQRALKDMMNVFKMSLPSPIKFPENYGGNNFLEDAREELVRAGLLVEQTAAAGGHALKEAAGFDMGRFMNRILGLHVRMQNAIFQFFVDMMDYVIEAAKKEGKFDVGTMEMGKPDAEAQLLRRVYFRQNDKEHSITYISTVQTERGITYDQACAILEKNPSENGTGRDNGFYRFKGDFGIRPYVLLAIDKGKTSFSRNKTVYDIYRPNTGRGSKSIFYDELTDKYVKITDKDQERRLWSTMYQMTATQCSHRYTHGTCRAPDCVFGTHRKTDYVLHGSVLGIWSHMEGMLVGKKGKPLPKMQIVRVLFKGMRVIGVQLSYGVYPFFLDILREAFGKETDDTDVARVQLVQAEEQHQKEVLAEAARPHPSIAAPLPGSMTASSRKTTSFPGASTSAVQDSESESEEENRAEYSSSDASRSPSPVAKKRDIKPKIEALSQSSSGTSHARDHPSSSTLGTWRDRQRNTNIVSRAAKEPEIICLSSDEEDVRKPLPPKKITTFLDSSDEDLPPVRASIVRKKVLRLISSSDEDVPNAKSSPGKKPSKPNVSVSSPGKSFKQMHFKFVDQDAKQPVAVQPPGGSPLKVKTSLMKVKPKFGFGVVKTEIVLNDSDSEEIGTVKPKPRVALFGAKPKTKSVSLADDTDSDEIQEIKVVKKEVQRTPKIPSSLSSQTSSPLRTINKEIGPIVGKIDVNVVDDSGEDDSFGGNQGGTDSIHRTMKRKLSKMSIDSDEF